MVALKKHAIIAPCHAQLHAAVVQTRKRQQVGHDTRHALALARNNAQKLLFRVKRQLSGGIERMSKGDYEYRVHVQGKGEMAQLAAAFNQMSEQVHNLDEARNQFVSNASHELKTPLATLGIYNGILQDATDDPETLREMSDKLGSYTTSSYQLSASNGKYTTPSNSQSVSLTERKLLNTDEVRRVKRPHQIITSRDHPAMMYAPDLSQWMFNKMLGLGDMEHNRRLREEREQKRPIITDTKQEIALWNIWIYYQKDIMRRLSQQKGAMGGGLDDD